MKCFFLYVFSNCTFAFKDKTAPIHTKTRSKHFLGDKNCFNRIYFFFPSWIIRASALETMRARSRRNVVFSLNQIKTETKQFPIPPRGIWSLINRLFVNRVPRFASPIDWATCYQVWICGVAITEIRHLPWVLKFTANRSKRIPKYIHARGMILVHVGKKRLNCKTRTKGIRL